MYDSLLLEAPGTLSSKTWSLRRTDSSVEQELWGSASRPAEQRAAGSSVLQEPGPRAEAASSVKPTQPLSASTDSSSQVSAASGDRSPSNRKGSLIEERGLQMRRAMERKEAQQFVDGLLSVSRFPDEKPATTDAVIAELTFDGGTSTGDDEGEVWSVSIPSQPTRVRPPSPVQHSRTHSLLTNSVHLR